MGATVLSLACAIVPGALRLQPEHRPLDRAMPWSIATLDVVPAALSTPPPSDAVPIIPPEGDLTGELAPSVPTPAPFVSARHGRPGVYALIVGIDDYPGGRSDLRSAVADADTVDAALAGFGVPPANRVVLRNGQARKAELVAAIRSLVEIAGPDSTVVFAYAGHVRKLRAGTEAIVAADGGLLTDAELASLLEPSPAQRMWLLVAACYAGGFTEVLGPGRVLTAAADADSLAYESRSINGSYLVHHLVREGWLQGMAGRSVQEAFAYADRRISEEGSQGRPVEFDGAGAPLILGSGDPATERARPADQRSAPPSSGGGSPQPNSPPPSSPTTTEPEKVCTLFVLCE